MINIRYQGHIPCKHLGQNFLIDKPLILQIVKLVKPSLHELFIEIGPGLGSLTQPFSELLKRLFVIEIDLNLVNKLKKMFFKKKISIIQNNVITFNFLNFFNIYKQPIRIFGNLPYNISTKLILNLLSYKHIFYDMHFMLQKEFAERLTASKGSKSYGRLSVLIQCHYDVKSLINISPESFFPKPKVNSCFVQLIPKNKISFSFETMTMLSKITNLAFQQRRKILRNSLSQLFTFNQLIQLGINPYHRAQNLSVSNYIKLACYLTNC